MKRILPFILALALLLSAVGGPALAAGSGNWPVRSFSGVGIEVKSMINNKNVKRQAYLGPNAKTYASGGAFRAASVQNSVALFREGDYALVDFYYSTMGKYCIYFLVRDLSGRNIEEVRLTAYPAKVTYETQAMLGPGYDYRALEELTQNKARKEIWLRSGTWIDVFFEMNGWVFAEFSCSMGMVRAWLPASSVSGI